MLEFFGCSYICYVSGGLFNRHPAFISVQTVLLISSTSSFIDKIRKLYFDSAHNKTVQHKLYRAFYRIYINNKTTQVTCKVTN